MDYFPKLPWVESRSLLYKTHEALLDAVGRLILQVNPLEKVVTETDLLMEKVELMLSLMQMKVGDFKLKLEFPLPGMSGQAPSDLVSVQPVTKLPRNCLEVRESNKYANEGFYEMYNSDFEF